MARNRRSGGPNVAGPRARAALPRAHESVHRFPGEDVSDSRSLLARLVRAAAVPRQLAAQALRRPPQVFLKSRAGPRGQRRRATFFPLHQLELKRKDVVCVRRNARREVLFAQGKAGYGGSAPGRYRRTSNSNYSC